VSKRFYFSTKKTRLPEAAKLLEALTAEGWKRTFVWTDRDAGRKHYPDLAQRELAGIRDADVVVVLLPGGFGTHVEIGAALALGKPILLHSTDRKTLNDPYPCPFHYHPTIKLLISKKVNVRRVIEWMAQYA
jgi:nucleoside 2-deoxyribosyltransferase